MHLHDILQVCLLSLEARYPKHTLDVNLPIFASQTDACKGWTARQLLTFLRTQVPYLLAEPASLYINDQICAIFLPAYTQDTPAITIHCRGKMPHSRQNSSPVPDGLSASLAIKA